jgi:DNA-binding CsgD family transcriptional regulator/PAS domain-containing protein
MEMFLKMIGAKAQHVPYRGSVAGLQYRAGSEGRVSRARFVRLDPAIQEAMCAYYSGRNPWVRRTQHLLTPGVVVATPHILPLAELRRTAYHSGVLRPAGVVHGFGGCVLRRGDDLLTFTVVRSAAAEPFESAELERVRAVLPHLRRAVQVNERLSDLQRTHAALLDGLDQLRDGVVIIDGSGHVTYANRTARAIVARRDGLAIAADGLTAATHADRIKLRGLIDGAVRSAAGDGDGSGGTMLVARPSMKRPFPVVVAPFRLVPDRAAALGLATIFISDPDAHVETADDMDRRLYGLTPTESRVAHALAQTGNLAEAANHLRINRETARWHLKRIYRKTGTDRQPALIRQITASTRLRLDVAAAASTAHVSRRHD